MSLKDFQENCRLCLDAFNDKSRYLITEKTEHNFLAIFNIELYQNILLSTFICQQCSNKLKEIDEFKTKIRNNQEFLRGLVENESSKQDLEEQVEENELLQIKEKKIKKKKLEVKTFPDKKCPICEKEFTEARKIPLHIKRIHTKQKDFFCDFPNCDYSAFTKFDISRHHRNIHMPSPESPTDRRICPHCAKVVRGNNQLTLHIRKKHLNIKKFQCDLCSFASYGKYEIKSHLQHMHIPKQFKTSYACSLCTSVLSSAMGLKVHHIHKHSKIKNFSCFCGKAFSLKETLKTHIKNVHKGERKFACNLCPKRFGQSVRLRDHFNNYHGSKQEIPCSQCNKVFHSSRNLKAHQIYHADPQFKCNSCGKKFFLSNKLKEHEKTHELGAEHSCNLCSRQFQLLSSLKRHIKNHEKSLVIE